MLELSTSEDVDVLSIDVCIEFVDLPLHPSAYEKLVEFVTHAVAKLNIEWPHEKQEAQKKSKLDKLEWGLPFFSILAILHNKLCRSWKRLFSSRMKGMGRCYVLKAHLMLRRPSEPNASHQTLLHYTCFGGKSIYGAGSGWCVPAHYGHHAGVPG